MKFSEILELTRAYLKEHPQSEMEPRKRITPHMAAQLVSIGVPLEKACKTSKQSAQNKLKRNRKKRNKAKNPVFWNTSIAKRQLKQHGLALDHPEAYKISNTQGDSPTLEQIRMLTYLGISRDVACGMNRLEAADLIKKLKKQSKLQKKLTKPSKPKQKKLSVWEKARLEKEAEKNASDKSDRI